MCGRCPAGPVSLLSPSLGLMKTVGSEAARNAVRIGQRYFVFSIVEGLNFFSQYIEPIDPRNCERDVGQRYLIFRLSNIRIFSLSISNSSILAVVTTVSFDVLVVQRDPHQPCAPWHPFRLLVFSRISQLKQAGRWRKERRANEVLSEEKWSTFEPGKEEIFWLGRCVL